MAKGAKEKDQVSTSPEEREHKLEVSKKNQKVQSSISEIPGHSRLNAPRLGQDGAEEHNVLHLNDDIPLPRVVH